MNRFFYIILTWLSFLFMFSLNVLANYLPLNGYDTGELSALYPNKFVPDGFTFSIWGVIYMWLLVFVGYSNKLLIYLPDVDQRVQRIKYILPLFWVSCLLNGSWILTWHYLNLPLSLIIMVLLLVTLILLFVRITQKRAHPRKRDHLLVEVPFIIYLGWISVATIANTTALLVHYDWNGFGISDTIWSILMMGIAGVLSIWFSLKWHRPAYSLVVCWALWGIFRSQGEMDKNIGYAALFLIFACLIFAFRELVTPKRGWQS